MLIEGNGRQAVLAQIQHAFSGVFQPSTDAVAYLDDWDADSINAELGAWVGKAPPEELIARHAKSLSALQPDAFAYFLGAYMQYSIYHIESEVTEVLVSNLISATTSSTRYWKERIGRLSKEQRAAICAYIAYLSEQSHDQLDASEIKRLEEFWAKNHLP